MMCKIGAAAMLLSLALLPAVAAGSAGSAVAQDLTQQMQLDQLQIQQQQMRMDQAYSDAIQSAKDARRSFRKEGIRSMLDQGEE